MKEEILEILENSEKSLDATSIMSIIKNDYTSLELKNVLNELDILCKEGIVYLTKNNKYILFERSNLLKGVLQITSSGSGFLLLEGQDLYIPMSNLNGASNSDLVIAEVIKEKKNKKEGRVVRIIQKSIGSSLAEVFFDKSVPRLKLLDEDLKDKYDLVLSENEFNLVEGLIVKIEILKEVSKNKFSVKILNVVGHKNAPDIDILKICSEFNIETEFNNDVIEEVKSIPSFISESEIKNRKDLRDEVIFTIDGEDTKDIDDAISIKKLENGNYELGVHIADVSYYVKEDSYLKKSAFKRGNSVYLADRVIPMLPVELSNGICSLNEEVDRFAFSCVMEIDNNGNTVNYNIFKSIIRSRKKMTYENVNRLLGGENLSDYMNYKDDLFLMKELYEILDKAKEKAGKLDFISEEIKLLVDDKGKVIEVKKYETGIGQKLIENFMIAANETVGTHVYNMDLPFVYRVHDKPSPKKLSEFISFVSLLGHTLVGKHNFDNVTPKELQNLMIQMKDFNEYKVLNKKLLRCMKKAEYSSNNIGHFGIALSNYSHFTSPIRRYSDLMVHFFLNEYLVNNNYSNDFINNWNNKLPFICEHISKTEIDAEECEREVNDMKIAEYMENHIGEEFIATIDGCLSKGFFVETDNLISGLVSLDMLSKYYVYNQELNAYLDKKKRICYRIGDKVKVKCIGASKEKRQVDFTICEVD